MARRKKMIRQCVRERKHRELMAIEAGQACATCGRGTRFVAVRETIECWCGELVIGLMDVKRITGDG